MRPLLATLDLVVLAALPGAIHALDDFSWGFSGQSSSSAIQECATININLDDGSRSISEATPPFTMFAYPSTGGLPIMQTLGSSPHSLKWQVQFPTGSQIVMNIYDQQGRSSGWLAPYSVLAGTDTSCLPASTESDVTLEINTTTISPCGVLGISGSGGTPPYTVNVLPFGGLSDTTNYTLPDGDTWFNWVANVTTPNTMMVGLRDSNNAFAVSPPPLQLTGSNATCTSSSFAEASAPGGAASATIGGTTATGGAKSGGGGGSSSSAGPIAGGVVGGIVAIGIIAGALWFFLRKKNRKREGGAGSASKLEKGRKLGKAGMADGIAGGDGKKVKTVPPGRTGSEAEKNDAPDAAITPFTGGTADSHPLPGATRLQPARSTAKNPPAGRQPAAASSSRPATAESQGANSNFVLSNPDPDHHLGPSTSRGGGGTSAAVAAAAAQEEGKDARPGTPPERRFVQHEDAGVYQAPSREDLPPEEIPPSYNSVQAGRQT